MQAVVYHCASVRFFPHALSGAVLLRGLAFALVQFRILVCLPLNLECILKPLH